MVLPLCFIALLCGIVSVGRSESLDSIVFPSNEESNALSPRRDAPPRTTPHGSPRYGYDNNGGHFNVQPTSDGGFSASAGHSSSFAGSQSAGAGNNFGASHAGSQSHSVNFQVGQNGFSASQSSSASQAASFNSNIGNQGSSLSASQASSQSSSFSGGGGGGGSSGAASSQAASAGFSGGGGAASLASGAANSQSSGRPGNNYNPNILSPDFIRTQRPRPGTNRNDRRRRPTGPFFNSWFNPYWNARGRRPGRQ